MQNPKQLITVPKVIMGAVELINGGAATVASSQNTTNNTNIYDGNDSNQTQFVSGDIGGAHYYSQITLDLTTPLAPGAYSVIELANVDVTTPGNDNGAIKLHLLNENEDEILSVDFSNQPDGTGQDIQLYVGAYAQPVHLIKIEQSLYNANHSAMRIGEVKLRPNPVSAFSSQGFVYEISDLETLSPLKYVSGGQEYASVSGEEFIELQLTQQGATTTTTASGGDTINISGSTCASGIFTVAPSGLSLYAIVGDCDSSVSGGELLNTSSWAFDASYTEGTRANYTVNLTNVGQSPLSALNYHYQFVDSRLCTTTGPGNRCYSIFLYPSGEITPSGSDTRLGGGKL